MQHLYLSFDAIYNIIFLIQLSKFWLQLQL